MSDQPILVTGGAGFIGSLVVVELVKAGYSVIIADSHANDSNERIDGLEEICGRQIPKFSVDITDKSSIQDLFKRHKFRSVVHLAGLKIIGESCSIPLKYYRVNVIGTVNLIEVMRENNVKNLIFASSAAVYGNPQYLPLDENHPTGNCQSPYGKSKHCVEEMLKDFVSVHSDWNIIILRYFNAAGAHKTGLIGDNINGVPTNLISYCAQVANEKRKEVVVYGKEYDTHDGSGVRDYVHVEDLANAHVLAHNKLEKQSGLKIYNLGSGQCYSVLDVIKSMSRASGKPVPYIVRDSKPGDVGSFYCNPDLAKTELGWGAQRSLDEMCEDCWRWQSEHKKETG